MASNHGLYLYAFYVFTSRLSGQSPNNATLHENPVDSVHLTSIQARFWNRVSHSNTDGDTQQCLRPKNLDVIEAYNHDIFTASPRSQKYRKSAVRN